MPNNNTPREIMSALIEGRKPTRRSDSVYVGTVQWGDHECPAIFSYGPHFPMAVKNGPDWGVTTDRYSRTTSMHMSGVRTALTDAGYHPCDRSVFHVNGTTFERWSKHRA